MKKNKLIIYREGQVDKNFHRGVNLFMVITLLALFSFFIAFNKMTNAQTELKSVQSDNTLYQDRITELNKELSNCNLMNYNNCTGYSRPLILVNVTVDRVE